MDMIRVENLTKIHSPETGIFGVSFSVHEGEVYGLIGPNGAGKTTTVRLLLGMAFPTSGTISIMGQPVPSGLRQLRGRIGVLLDSPTFLPQLTAEENLRVLSLTQGGSQTREQLRQTLEGFGLEKKVLSRRAKGLSHGQRQRLAIAAALLGEPELVILDEPLSGLDPGGVIEIREIINALRHQGRTVLYSSPILTEVQQVCTRVGFINQGRLVGEYEVPKEPEGSQSLEAVYMRLVLGQAAQDSG